MKCVEVNLGSLNNIQLQILLQNQISGNKTAEVQKMMQTILTQNLADILQQLSLPKTENYENLAKALIEYNQPLDKSTLEILNRVLQQLDGQKEDNINLLAFLKSKNIPPHKEIVQIVKGYLGEKSSTNLVKNIFQEQVQQSNSLQENFLSTNLGKQVEYLLKNNQQINQQINQTRRESIKSSVPKVIQELLLEHCLQKYNEEKQFLQKETLNIIQDLSTKIGDKLVDKKMNLLFKQVNDWLKSFHNPQEEQKIFIQIKEQISMFKDSFPAKKEIFFSLNKILVHLEQGREKIQIINDNILKTVERIMVERSEKQGEVTQSTFLEEVKKGISQKKILEDNGIKNLVLNLDGHENSKLSEECKRAIEQKKVFLAEPEHLAEENINREPILTKALADLKGAWQTENLLKFCEIPLQQGKDFLAAKIKVDQETRDKNGNEEEKSRIVVFLETKNLGQVKIDLTKQEKGLAFSFGVEKEETKAQLENNFTDLEERLLAFDYIIKELNCLVQKENPVQTFLEMEKNHFIGPLRKIDLLT